MYAPATTPQNAIRLGPRARRLIRSVARLVNPLVLRAAGRPHMPVLGIVQHRGRKTGHRYATPLGIRPAAAGGFVMPLTFGEAAGWYRNILATGWCVITWRGQDHMVSDPVVVDREAALPAFPRYERLALRAIGINEFLWLRPAPDQPGGAVKALFLCDHGENGLRRRGCHIHFVSATWLGHPRLITGAGASRRPAPAASRISAAPLHLTPPK